jgi:glucoamylase
LIATPAVPAVASALPLRGDLTPPILTSDGLGTGSTVTAPGGPGAASYYDEARKDCVGTSASQSSKIWFTVADGQLSDVYEPTIDNTDVKSMEWIVTNGSTWTDVQSRDMSYTVSSDPSGMSCTVTVSDAAHGYSLTTTYFTDPFSDAVIARTFYKGPAGLQVYARLQPLVNGNGGGGTANAGGNSAQVYTTASGGDLAAAWSTNTVTAAVNRSYAVPTYEVLTEAGGLGATSAGYAGTASDGANSLASTYQLPDYNSAPDGDVVLTAQVKFAPSDSANLALGFGRTLSSAVGVAQQAADAPPGAMLARYLAGWHGYDAFLNRPSASLTLAQKVEYYRAINVVKASEDKTFPGAIVAGLASPWGQSVPAGVDAAYGLPTFFGSYREVFARDLYEAFTALLVAGDIATARAATLFLFDDQQQANGSMPRNSLLNGQPAPDTGGLQLDETSYPIIMAWQSGLSGDHELYVDHVVPAADFLVANGPADGVERWEEQSGYSPSTIAAEIAGLTAASAIAARNGDVARARLYQATADYYARNIKTWTVTTVPDAAYSAQPYFIRIAPDGNPNDGSTLNLGNGGPSGVPQQQVIDAGFLELVRLGVLPASDPTIESSLTVVDNTIEVQTPSGPGFYRYGALGTVGSTTVKGGDGYGDCYQPSLTSCSISGAPWAPTGTGTGHPWPVLNGERGEYDVASGQGAEARTMLQTMLNMTTGAGIEPEQVWDDPALAASPYGSDPTTASIGFTPGSPDGSASPLTWAEAQYVRLATDIGAGRDVEQPSIVAARYVAQGMPASLPLKITSPAPGTTTASTTETISGTTAPGATVDVEGWDPLQLEATWVSTVTAGSSGAWSVTATIGFGTTTITASATAGPGRRQTGYAQTNVVSTTLPGTSVFTLTDTATDDNGPGTYAYPTASAFQPGAFDLTGLQVNETADEVYVTIGVENLAPTFGNAIGAQLFDIYVDDPSATVTSTAAAYATRNYTISPPQAWSERLEIQGFASPQWVNASGENLGTAQYVAEQQTNSVTIVLPRSVFGSPGAGWSFLVALTGQNGFNADQARSFTATPGAYTFGVCSVAETEQVPENPICNVDPNEVPEAMSILTSGDQQAELDPLDAEGNLRVPVLTGVTIP